MRQSESDRADACCGCDRYASDRFIRDVEGTASHGSARNGDEPGSRGDISFTHEDGDRRDVARQSNLRDLQ